MSMPAAIELTRPWNCILAGLGVLVAGFIAGESIGIAWSQADMIRMALAFAAAALVTGGGNAINDYCDRKIDKINRPGRPIPSGRIKDYEALTISQILFMLGIIATIFVSMWCVLLAAANAIALTLYASKFKCCGLAGNAVIGYLVGSTFLFGGLAIEELSAVGILAAMAGLSTVGRELIKDIEDMPGDRKLKMDTFPLRHGARKAAVLAAAFIVAAIVLSPVPYLQRIFPWQYLIPLAAAIAVFICAAAMVLWNQKPKSAGYASLGCKIAMGLGLLAFLVGTLELML